MKRIISLIVCGVLGLTALAQSIEVGVLGNQYIHANYMHSLGSKDQRSILVGYEQSILNVKCNSNLDVYLADLSSQKENRL